MKKDAGETETTKKSDDTNEDQNKLADEFDTAISACGFGCMNITLIVLSFPMACAIIFSTSVLAFALTQIECDIEVTLTEMGLLNSITYIGMIFGGLFWAFISDLKGRRMVLILTHLIDAVFATCASLAQSFTQILIFKFICGISISGGYATFMTYLSEMNSKEYRTRMLFSVGIMLSLSAVLIPIIALIILTHHWHKDIDTFFYTSWQLFMTVCAIPSLIVGIAFCFLPESPKFDLTKGNTDRAMQTFEKIHRCNKGSKTPFTSPVFTNSLEQKNQSVLESLKKLKIVITKKYFIIAILLFSIEFFTLMCQNTLRLWTPVFFVALDKLEGDSFEFCAIIDTVSAVKNSTKGNCGRSNYEANSETLPSYERTIACRNACTYNVSPTRYIGNIVIAVVVSISFIIVILIVNKVGPKLILCISLFIATIGAFALYVVRGRYLLFVPFTIYLSVEYISAIALVNACVSFFPTQVRTVIVTTTMVIGRIGSILGNILFPYLMSKSCLLTIMSLGVCTLITFVLSLILPNPSKAKFN